MRANVAAAFLLLFIGATPRIALSATPALAGGHFHSCAVDVAGGALCWGDNQSGQLGTGTSSSSSTPTKVQGLPGPVTSIAIGGVNIAGTRAAHTCALTTAGDVYCWGNNFFGQLGTAPSFGSPVPAAVPGLGSGVRSISARESYSCAVTASNDLRCWGQYPTLSTAFPSGVRAVATGRQHVCVLMLDARVLCWGINGFYQLGSITTNPLGEFSDVPLEVHGIPFSPVAIVAGGQFNCVLSAAGAVWCWGSNSLGQLGDGSDPFESTQSATPVPATGLGSDVVAIAAGEYHACAVKSQGEVRCWGSNFNGGLGADAPYYGSRVPIQVQNLPSGVKTITGGLEYTCAATDSGLAMCWGSNESSQLGEGTSASKSRPNVVRREASAGTLASNDWFLDLNPAAAKVIPAQLTPPFLATVSGTTTTATADVSAEVQFRQSDVGKPIYVFGYAPASIVHGVASVAKDGTTPCVLAQLTPDGTLVPASSSSLQALGTNVANSQRQTVSVLGRVPSSGVTGATFCVGTATASAQAVSVTNSQCVATVPPPTGSSPGQQTVCLPPTTDAHVPAALSGLFYNPGESGWGVSFTQRGANVFAAWYTYDVNGAPKWYVSTCAMNGGAIGTTGTCSGALYQVTGPRFFGATFNPASANAMQAGNLQVTFADTDHATMTYTAVAGQTRSVQVMRQPLAAGSVPGVNYTDLWWNSSESGWGMTFTQQASTGFIAWYVYDSNGNPTWYVATCSVTATACSGNVLQTTGPRFGATFDSSQVRASQAGTISVNFVDPDNAVIDYTVNGVSGSKTVTRQIF